MNNSQKNKFDTCARVQDFNTKNASIVATIKEYAEEQKTFDDAYLLAQQAAQAQATTANTNTDAVDIAKHLMADTVFKYASRGSVKAKQAGNTSLADALDIPTSFIYRADKVLAVQRARDIEKLLKDNLGILTNIDASNINEIDKTITDYDAIKDQPTIANQTKKATGTNPLPGNLSTAFSGIDGMYKLLVSYFGTTKKPLVDSFALAMQIISTGVHHTGIEGVVTKNGQPVVGALVSIGGTKKFAKTDAKGHYSISRIKVGIYTIDVRDENGDNTTQTVAIVKGHIEIVDFTL